MSDVDAVVGIDVAKAKFDCAWLCQGKFKTRVFANTPQGFEELRTWLSALGGHPLLCMEATGSYHEALATHLADTGYRVAVVNPLRIKRFAEAELVRAKTDRLDARLIARFAAAHRPALWLPPAPEVRVLRDLVRRLEALLDLKGQETNRLGVASAPVRPSIETVLGVLDAEITAIRAKIRDHLDQHPGLRHQKQLLDTIPGLGETTIALLLAEVNFQAFDQAREVAAFTGLVPRRQESGTLRGRTRLSKVGSSRLRRALYMPAIVAIRHNPLIRGQYQRLLANGKSKMAAIGAAMRKLVHIAFGVLKSGKPFDPNIALGA